MVKTPSGEYLSPDSEMTFELYQSTLRAGNEIKMIAENNVTPTVFEQTTGSASFLIGAIVTAITGFLIVFLLERITEASD